MRRPLLAVLCLVALPAAGTAQAERYELGRRLVDFEKLWEVATPEGRKRALAVLPAASTQFLTLRLGDAARTLDDARFALISADPPTPAARFLRSLAAVPERRLMDPRQPLVVEVRPFYPTPGPPPAGAVVLADLYGGPGGGLVPTSRPGQMAVLNMAEVRAGRKPQAGDFTLTVRHRLNGRFADNYGLTVSQITDLEPRLAAAKPAAGLPPLEAATVAARVALLRRLAAGEHPESNIPAGRFLKEVEEMMAAGKPFFTVDRPGDHWLAVPTGTDATPCRLFVPEELAADKPVPLVVALHGAGGSENMFFESYGAGHIVKECQKRGWLLVAPRCGLLTTPPVAEVVAKLRERYPIDRQRVFLVGHSMGAGQAAELPQRHPGTFAALAVLGGGGRVRQKELLTDLPIFIGMGTADFARRSGQAFVKALDAAGAKRVTAKEYDGLEHLVIVREALPDVFAAWDAIR